MKGLHRVAIYARVSSSKQAEENTIASQLEAVRESILATGHRVTEDLVYKDEGYSGATLLRPALEQLRDAVAASSIDIVYVYSPDRLARKMAHQALLLEEFSRCDCKVVFVNQGNMPETPESNLLIQMQGMIAEYEREKILERTRRGRRYSAKMGNVSVFSGAPYGYRYISKTEGNGQARWEINPITSKHVQLIFKLVGDQEQTLAAVQRELTIRSIPTATNKSRWDRSTIRGILLNPAYFGEARYGKQRLTPRKVGKRAKRGDPKVPRQAKVAVPTNSSAQITISVPAIIDKELFDRVRLRMKENQRRQRSRQNRLYMLSGLLICGECGSAYCSRRQGERLYYRCIGTEKHRFEGNAICTNRSVKGHELEALVWEDLCHLLRNPARLRNELQRRQESQSPTSSQIKEQERRVKSLRERLDRLIDIHTEGQITKAEFTTRVTRLRDQHDSELSTLSSLQGQQHDSIDYAQAERALEQFQQSVESNLATASLDLKANIAKLLIKQIEITVDQVRIVYKVPERPFDSTLAGPGKLQHCLSRHAIASDFSPMKQVIVGESPSGTACGSVRIPSLRDSLNDETKS